MPYATGLRITAFLCIVVGGLSVIGIPILWPVGFYLSKKAKEKEEERSQELEVLHG